MTSPDVYTLAQLLDAIEQAYREGWHDAEAFHNVQTMKKHGHPLTLADRPVIVDSMWAGSVSASYAKKAQSSVEGAQS